MVEVSDDRVSELRRRASWFELVVENVDTVIYIATADFSEVLYVNSAYERLYGQSVETLRERPRAFVEAAHPEDRERYERDVEAMVADVDAGDAASVYEGEYRLLVDGETRWVRVARYPVTGHGDAEYVVGTVEDITDERALERTYRDIFEHVSDGLVVHDPDTGEILDVNQRYCELTGYDRETLVGADVGVVMADDPTYTESAARERIEAARDEGPQQFEWVGQRAEGTRFDAEISLSIVAIEGRERVLASVRDVSARKRRERERAEERRKYTTLVEGSDDGVVIVQDGRYAFVNDRFCELTGRDREDLLEMSFDEVFAPEYRELVRDRYERRIAGESPPSNYDVELLVDGERVDVELTVSHITHDGDPATMATFRDITERKRQQRVLETLHASTERIQNARTTQAVCEAAVTAMEEVLDLSLPVCWLRREGESDDPVLEPVAMSDAAREYAGGPDPLDPDSFEYDVYREGDAAVYDPSVRWDTTPLRKALMVAVGDHGVMGAADPDVEEFDEVTLDAARILARHTTTALDRVARIEERRESERRMGAILNRIDEAIFLTDGPALLDNETGSVYVSAGYADVFGLSYADLAADDSMEFVDLVHPEDRETYQAELRERVSAVERRDYEDSYVSEYRIERPDGEMRWVRSDFYPIEWAEDDYRFVVVSRDVTERKEREATLETFHEATRDLTEAASRTEASRVAVEAADRTLGFSHVSIHLYDEAEGTLRPVSETETLRERIDFLPSFGPGDDPPWQVFVDGEAIRGDAVPAGANLYGRGVPEPDLVLPLGAHGVMLVGTPDREFDAETVELAQILAATLEGALNHVQGQDELREREAELEAHRERVDRLERLNTVIREIEQATVEESSRDAIERVVCDRLTSVGPYQVAWIAAPDGRRETLVARTTANGDATVDALTVDLPGDDVDAHPAAEAFTDRETRTVQRVATATHGEWRKPLLRAGYQSLTAVPLAHEETVHGVLCIAADDPTAFDERAETVLSELGRSIGYALSVLERRRALESDTTTELEFRGRDERLLFVRLADETDADVTLERAIRRSNGRVGGFYRVEGATPEEVREAVAAIGRVADVTLVSTATETCLVELETASWFGRHFVDHGAVVQAAEVDDDTARVVVEAPQAADVRTLVTGFRESHPDVELLAQRTRERSVQTLLELQDLLEERLTPRQLETLETAYSAGYFDWPREQSGEEIAELLGITQPTFNKHLRSAERKTFAMLLNREFPEGT